MSNMSRQAYLVLFNSESALYEDIRQYYLNNPPIEIDPTNPQLVTSYNQILDKSLQDSLREYSKFRPIFDEKIIITKKGQYYLRFYEIHELFMDFEIFEKFDKIYNTFYSYFISEYAYEEFEVDDLLKKGNLLTMIVADEIVDIYQKYFGRSKEHIVLRGNQIKVKPETKYYVLFKRYRTKYELYNDDEYYFRRLVDVNLRLGIYGSWTYFSEQGIKSVSLSGLSITFNVPDANRITKALYEEKDRIFQSLSFDLPERF